MDIPMMDSYLESLASFIYDDDKLVTYKWLSKELEVHVNIAKIILWRYWQKHKKNGLVATFMLIGNLKKGGMRVEVVEDRKLAEAKDKFEKIISEHIYSLQKTSIDIELLASAGRGDSRYGAITCEQSFLLSEEELSTMRWGIARAPSKKDVPVVKETPKTAEESLILKTETKSEEKSKKVSPPSKQKSIEKKGVSKKVIPSTKAGFGHLFGKATDRRKAQAVPSLSNDAGNNARNDSERKVDGSFSMGKPRENEESLSVLKDAIVSSPEENDNKKLSETASAKPEKGVKTTSSKMVEGRKRNKTARGTKRGRSRESEDETKKRKRIVVTLESSDESATGSSIEEIFDSPPPSPNKDKSPPPSPNKDKSPSPPSVERQGNKRKVRKFVDKTFVDDDGYLITKKVHVYESCSDEELEVVEPNKRIEPEIPKRETKAPVKKKQTSLMSFFKKD